MISDVIQQLKSLSTPEQQKVEAVFGSLNKCYATIYLVARNGHMCEVGNVPAADQRMRTIQAMQGMIRFILEELGLDGKDIQDQVTSDYLDDYVNYKEQDFGMSNQDFIDILQRVQTYKA